jgi:hypothetical protein
MTAIIITMTMIIMMTMMMLENLQGKSKNGWIEF